MIPPKNFDFEPFQNFVTPGNSDTRKKVIFSIIWPSPMPCPVLQSICAFVHSNYNVNGVCVHNFKNFEKLSSTFLTSWTQQVILSLKMVKWWVNFDKFNNFCKKGLRVSKWGYNSSIPLLSVWDGRIQSSLHVFDKCLAEILKKYICYFLRM